MKELSERNGELSKLLLDYKKVQAELIQSSETNSNKVVSYKNNIKRLCDKLKNYSVSKNERKMVDSIIKSTFGSDNRA